MGNVAATTYKMYANANKEAYLGRINFTSDTIKIMLITSAKAPTQADTYKDTIGYTEVSGTNYIAGGYTLGGKNVQVTGNTTYCTATDVAQTGAVITGIRYAVAYDDTPVSNKPLLGYWDFGQDVSVDGTLTLDLNALGVFSVTAN